MKYFLFRQKRLLALLMVMLLTIGLFGCGGSKQQNASSNTSPVEQSETQPTEKNEGGEDNSQTPAIDEDGIYDSKEDVALYIHTYGHLPSNYITKKEAQNLGWSGGDLRPYASDKCIGGSRFGNNEGLLPDENGRQYYECDIDTLNQKARGAKRLVYSNDGLIFYTEDHYESFERLY